MTNRRLFFKFKFCIIKFFLKKIQTELLIIFLIFIQTWQMLTISLNHLLSLSIFLNLHWLLYFYFWLKLNILLFLLFCILIFLFCQFLLYRRDFWIQMSNIFGRNFMTFHFGAKFCVLFWNFIFRWILKPFNKVFS